MMRIVCPACAAAYDVPEDLVRSGRRTRCARCGETWALVTESPDPAGLDAPAAPPGPPRRPLVEPLETQPLDRLVGAAPPPPPRPGSGVWIGWVATVIVLAACFWAGYTYRAEVMQSWPPSTRLYAALGLAR